jgi:hypothetical protein
MCSSFRCIVLNPRRDDDQNLRFEPELVGRKHICASLQAEGLFLVCLKAGW